MEECNAIDLRIQCTVRLRLRKVTLWKLYSPLLFWPSLNYGVCRIHWNGIRLGRCVKWTESNGRADGIIELHSPLGWRRTIYHTKNQKVKSYKTTKTKTFQWQSVSPVLDKPHICNYFLSYNKIVRLSRNSLLSRMVFQSCLQFQKVLLHTPKPKTQGFEKGYKKAWIHIT